MAFQLIRQFTTFSGGVIACYYDPENGTFNFTWSGTWSAPTTVTTSELGASEGDEVSYVCLDGDKHVLSATVNAPFLTVDVEEDSADCIVIPPPPPDPPPPPSDPPPVIVTLNYIAYQIKFKNDEGNIVEANIFDQDTYEEGREIEYRPLQPSGDPVILECIDNDEDKFTSIRAKQCILSFNNSQQLNLNLFSEGQDNRWYVEVKVSDEIKFKGFLVLNDLRENFLSPPTVVTLTATDNIGLLKAIPLTNFDGDSPITIRPKNNYRWLDYLGWALSKTSLRLPINIEHNLREEHYTSEPFWSRIYLDPKTWEEEIGVCVNCYQVLEKLLGEECFITQHNGEWWVIRVDEIDSRNRYVYKVASDLASWTLIDSDYDKTIKKTENIKWIERSPFVSLDRPHSFVKESFSFNYPKEIIDNIDFSRGNFNGIVIPTPGYTAYNLDDWLTEMGSDFYSTTPSETARIERKFEDGYEKERYVILPGGTADRNWIRSNPVPVGAKDKFTISVDFRYDSNLSGSGNTAYGIHVMLMGDDGTDYVFSKGVPTKPDGWVIYNPSEIIYRTIQTTWIQNTRDEREWMSISGDVDPVPVSGDIVVRLLGLGNSSVVQNVFFSNLQFEYIPFINGSYQKYSGQYWKVSQTGEYKAVREQEVYVSDSPRRLFKGAMIWFDSPAGKWRLAGDWYDFSLSPTPIPVVPSNLEQYGWFQAQSVWNQYRRVMRIFDGELRGITESDLPDLIHRYTLSDPSPHTRLRYFMCLHFSMSLKLCRWTAYFAEVFKTDELKTYDSTTEFKMIESR
jgi:hypothetical protein